MYCFLPTEVEGFGPLAQLALDMRWSWNHYADDVWRQALIASLRLSSTSTSARTTKRS